MGEAIAFLAIMLTALFAFAMAWRLVLIFVGLGPATYTAMTVGPFTAHAGISAPWALAFTAATWVIVYGLTLVMLALSWRATRIRLVRR